MRRSDADVLIVDLEDFTPRERRDEARRGLSSLLERWRAKQRITVVRINALDADGPADLAAAMPARPDVVAYPMTSSAAQMRALDVALVALGRRSRHRSRFDGDPAGVRNGARRRRGSRHRDGQRSHPCSAFRSGRPGRRPRRRAPARRRWSSITRAGASSSSAVPPRSNRSTHPTLSATPKVRCARHATRVDWATDARRSCVRNTRNRQRSVDAEPRRAASRTASSTVSKRHAARGEDRALVEGLWVEVPTYRNAKRLIERARRLTAGQGRAGTEAD